MIKKIFQSLIILFLFVPSLISDEFSVMTLNVDNLFDTKDDKNKDDKAYLPIELKQSEAHKKSCNRIRVNSWKNECLYLDWNEETKNAKLRNIANSIISYGKNGPDIIALQEVENNNILSQLLDLLKPYGYIDSVLIEGEDYRGIDTALITKFNIIDSKLHYIKFSGEFEGKDRSRTRTNTRGSVRTGRTRGKQKIKKVKVEKKEEKKKNHQQLKKQTSSRVNKKKVKP